MKTLSFSQQQLLKVLQIAPLKLSPEFSAETDIESPSGTENIVDQTPLAAAELASILAQDIQLALPTAVSWYIDLQISAPQLKDKQLITPPLSALQQKELKQALWQLLSALDED